MIGKKVGETKRFGSHYTGVAFTLLDGVHCRVLAEESCDLDYIVGELLCTL